MNERSRMDVIANVISQRCPNTLKPVTQHDDSDGLKVKKVIQKVIQKETIAKTLITPNTTNIKDEIC